VYKTTFSYLHPVGCDNAPDVWDHDLGEDFVDEAMVSHEASMGDVFHAQTII
jgi:hypothetical protein